MKQFPFEAEAFTSEPSEHEMPTPRGDAFLRFVLDMETVEFPRNPCVVDYDHDTKEPIGGATLAVENGSIIARGTLNSAIDGDRAFQIGVTSDGTPFGISPTLDLTGSTVETIPEGSTGAANGRVYDGPIAIYKNARVLGISVCPIPTDAQTSLTVLRKEGLVFLKRTGDVKMATELEPGAEPIPTDQNNQETLGDESGVVDGETQVRDKELQTFIDEFGLDKGVGFYQRSLSLDEAKMEDYADLKRLAKTTPLSDCRDDPQDDKKPDDAAQLCATVRSLLSRIDGVIKLAASNARKVGAPSSPPAGFIPKTAKPSYADAIRAAAGK